MSILEFYAPAKTFLLGEYAVLSSGKSLLLATNQGFELLVDTDHSQDKPSFLSRLRQHETSPAGLLWSDSCPLIVDLQTPGKGFGGSSAFAWFALLYKNFINDGDFSNDSLSCFRQYFHMIKPKNSHTSSYLSSGADIACQYYGRCTVTDLHNDMAMAVAWPFKEVGFVLIRTGVNLVTPKHLANLKFDPTPLTALVDTGLRAFKQADYRMFVDVIRAYQRCLQQQGLELSTTTDLLRLVSDAPGFLAAKGCGAMGAETICVLYDLQSRHAFTRYCDQYDVDCFAFVEDLADGLAVKESLLL